MIKVANKKWMLMGMVIILLIASCISVPSVMAEESNINKPLLKEQIDGSSYKITANKEREFSETEKIIAVNELEIFTTGRVTKSDEESLLFYERIAQSEYLQVKPIFYCEVEGLEQDLVLNRDDYFATKKARGTEWVAPNGYVSLVTNVWVSQFDSVDKRINIEHGVYWLKKPTTWNRYDYVVHYWTSEALYLANSAHGEIISTYSRSDVLGNTVYGDIVEQAIFDNGTASTYGAFKAYMRDNSNIWGITVFFSNLTLLAHESFNINAAFYHDQGFLPYNKFLDSVSVSAGAISVQLSTLFCKVKEYRSPEPITVVI